MSEHSEQAAVIAWADTIVPHHPELALLYAVPNAGKRGPQVAARMLAEGLRAGVPDLCLPVPRRPWAGLYIEMKHGRNKLQPSQVDWCEALHREGNMVGVCYGADAAIVLLAHYLDLPHHRLPYSVAHVRDLGAYLRQRKVYWTLFRDTLRRGPVTPGGAVRVEIGE